MHFNPEVVYGWLNMLYFTNGIQWHSLINTLIREEAHEESTTTRLGEHIDADGIVSMCANCRRVEHVKQPARWDWVPSLLSQGTLFKPSLCRFCFAYHYSGRSQHT